MIKTLKNSLYAQIILDKMRSTYKSLILPEKQLKKIFLRRVGYPLNLDNPQTFNEKLNWLKLYWHNPLIPICVDKYLVRNYLKERGLGYLLNDLIAKYDSVEEIDLQKLPNRFVLKATCYY